MIHRDRSEDDPERAVDFDTDRFGDDSRSRVIGQEPVRFILPRQSERGCFAWIEETLAQPEPSIEGRGLFESADRDRAARVDIELRCLDAELAVDSDRDSNLTETKEQRKSVRFSEMEDRSCVGDDPSQGESSFSDRAQRMSSC